MSVLSSPSHLKLLDGECLLGMQRARPLLFEIASMWNRKEHNLGRCPRGRGRGGAVGRGGARGQGGARGRGHGGGAPDSDPGDGGPEPSAAPDAEVAPDVVVEEVVDDDFLDPLIRELELGRAPVVSEQIITRESAMHNVMSVLARYSFRSV